MENVFDAQALSTFSTLSDLPADATESTSIPVPSPANVFTVYTKTDCFYCDKVKRLVTETGDTIMVVPCDSYISVPNGREAFLATMDKLAQQVHRTFPFVFHGTCFIGGCDETERYLLARNREITFDDEF